MDETNRRIVRDWLAILLRHMDERADRAGVLKHCARAHYDAIHMEDVIRDLKGNLPGFIDFLRTRMNWIVEHDEAARSITANENKPECVCPLFREGLMSDSALCDCSQGFAENMFGYILGKSVEASVVSSILRNGSRCIYKITY